MKDKKLTEIATEKKQYKKTDDLRQAIKFRRAKSCEIKIDNSIYNDFYGDEVYPFVSLIDSSFTNVSVAIDDECFIISDSTQHTITKIPLSVISDINYLQFDNCFNLVFIIEQFYFADMCFTEQH